jgi:hypothetical protein
VTTYIGRVGPVRYWRLAKLADRPSPMPQVAAAAKAPCAGQAEPAHDCVVLHPCEHRLDSHDTLTKASIAEAVAQLLGLEFAGVFDPREAAKRRVYFVPCDTLAAADAAQLGIRDWRDLFGGVAPYAFIATKVITHSLVEPEAAAPAGWTEQFGELVDKVVLDGYSVFTAQDARVAAARLLPLGALRTKDAAGVGGSGQTVITDMASLERLLANLDPAALRREGLVLERNLNRVFTHSVGQLRIGPWLVSYVGQQRQTRNHKDHEVYAGSSLRMVRGGLDSLLRQGLADDARTAVKQALVYHQAALMSFPGLFASRCNYDVVQGIDDAGLWRSGVLEQSWRIGGATGAELAALQALCDGPTREWVEASTHEIYAADVQIPTQARVHFNGVDPQVGALVKYAMVDAHDGP